MPISYQSDTSPMYVGRFPVVTALEAMAASLSAGQWGYLTPTGLNESELYLGEVIYPTESKINDTMLDWAVKGTWDSQRKFARICGTPAGLSTVGDGRYGGILSYDTVNNHVFNIRNPFVSTLSGIGHCFSSTAIDEEANILYKCVTGFSVPIQVYDLNNDTTSTLAYPVGSGDTNAEALDFNPNLGNMGGLLFFDQNSDKVHFFNKETQVWDDIAGYPKALLNPLSNNHNFCHYHPVTKKTINGSNADTITEINAVDEFGNLESMDAPPLAIIINSISFVADPNSNLSLCFHANGNVYPLDTSTGVWGASFPIPFSINNDNAPFSITELGVILFINYNFAGTSEIIVYKHTD